MRRRQLGELGTAAGSVADEVGDAELSREVQGVGEVVGDRDLVERDLRRAVAVIAVLEDVVHDSSRRADDERKLPAGDHRKTAGPIGDDVVSRHGHNRELPDLGR